MKIKDLQDKLVAVLGFGMEGKAVTGYLLKHGIKPVLFDQKSLQEWPEDQQEEIKSLGLDFIFGPDCFKELTGFNVAFRSPGIKLDNLNLKGHRNLILTSQTKWFFEHAPAKIIGITGTKGKGTTSVLTYEMLSSTRYPLSANIYLTGNIGKTQPLDILDELKASDWVVYELSSFQLQDLSSSPHIGVVLMVTSEHLDYHSDITEYVTAKEAITKFQKPDNFAIINADFEASMKIGSLGKGKKLYFSRQKSTGMQCLVKGGEISIEGTDFRLPIADLQLKGAHNLENICAASMAAHLAGASNEAIITAAKNFKGLEHRLELVGEKKGIKFYNDSFSTTPETAIAAIKAFKEPEILILGGSSKHSDFTLLAETIVEAKNIKALILVGVEAERIISAVNNQGGFGGEILGGAKNMPEIFNQIKLSATPGDIVLLSPACASFGMFQDYKDRGEQFKKLAQKF